MISSPKHIVLSRTDSIGDVMLSLPMAGILKKEFPGVHISFIGRSYTKAIIDCCSNVDTFINFDEIEQQYIDIQVQRFRDLNADVIIHVFPQPQIAMLAKRAGIKYRIGTWGRVFHWKYCNYKVRYSRKRSELHETQLNIKLLVPFHVNTAYAPGQLLMFYRFNTELDVPARIAKLLSKEQKNIILHPKSKGSAREWGVDRFYKLAVGLKEIGVNVFVSGTNDEGSMIREQKPELLTEFNDITGQLSLPEFISFIKASDGLVAASTGPLHIAAALGTFAVGLYPPIRPMHPGRWAPLGEKAHYIVEKKECNDCRKTMDCHCMKDIDHRTVRKLIMEELL